MCIDMNFTAHKEKDNKKMASYIYVLRGKKGIDDLEGLMWREKKI